MTLLIIKLASKKIVSDNYLAASLASAPKRKHQLIKIGSPLVGKHQLTTSTPKSHLFTVVSPPHKVDNVLLI